MAGLPPLKQRVAASRRFASKSKSSDMSTYRTALREAGGNVQRSGKARGNPMRQKELLSSYSRRTTESSRKRALRKLLSGYGLTTKENA
jgi:hypothetical protein